MNTVIKEILQKLEEEKQIQDTITATLNTLTRPEQAAGAWLMLRAMGMQPSQALTSIIKKLKPKHQFNLSSEEVINKILHLEFDKFHIKIIDKKNRDRKGGKVILIMSKKNTVHSFNTVYPFTSELVRYKKRNPYTWGECLTMIKPRSERFFNHHKEL